MAPMHSPQTEPPPTAKQKLLRKLFGRPQNTIASSDPNELKQGTTEPQLQSINEDPELDRHFVETFESLKPVTSRISRKVILDFSCAQNPTHQLSEQRCHLARVEPVRGERRAVDRRWLTFGTRSRRLVGDDLLEMTLEPASRVLLTLPINN